MVLSKTFLDGTIEDYFPNGLKLLVVDNDQIFLNNFIDILSSFNYKATICTSPFTALSMLKEGNMEFDLLLTGTQLPEMSGYELINFVYAEMGLPVILICPDEHLESMTKSLKDVPVLFVRKPIDPIEVEGIWKYAASMKHSQELKRSSGLVIPKKVPEAERCHKSLTSLSESNKKSKGKAMLFSEDEEKHDSQITVERTMEKICSKLDNARKISKHKKREEKENEYSIRPKKKKVLWVSILEQIFLDAVNTLGKETIPTKLLRFMNVEGLDRHQVASHLQKFREKESKREEKTYCTPNTFRSNMRPASKQLFPDELVLFNDQTDMQNPNFISMKPPTIPSSDTTYSLPNLSYVDSCLKKLQLNEDYTKDSQGLPFRMTQQENQGLLTQPSTYTWNEFVLMGHEDPRLLQPAISFAESNENQVYDHIMMLNTIDTTPIDCLPMRMV